MTELLTRPQRGDTGEDNRLAHIVDTTKYNLTEAYVLGYEVEALCGYRWVPSRDPEQFPECLVCVSIADEKGLKWR